MNVRCSYKRAVNPLGQPCWFVTVYDEDRRLGLSNWRRSVHEALAEYLPKLREMDHPFLDPDVLVELDIDQAP